MVTSGMSVATVSVWRPLPVEADAVPAAVLPATLAPVSPTATVSSQFLAQRSTGASTLRPFEAVKRRRLEQGTAPGGLSRRKKVAPAFWPATGSSTPFRAAP